jgi:dihydroorotate dehydrogenase
VITAVLRALDPETAHGLAIVGLKYAPLPAAPPDDPVLATTLAGLTLSNPVGLAAGLDKNAEALKGLAGLGFGFIECGSVTPRPQEGNPKPRIFRLVEDAAVINRLGFNNRGLDAFLENIALARYRGVLGANIGKNSDTPIERAADDYILGLRRVWPIADYVTVNISSPNTQALRSLQGGDALDALLKALCAERIMLRRTLTREVPMLVKIAPDLEPAHRQSLARLFVEEKLEGVINGLVKDLGDAVGSIKDFIHLRLESSALTMWTDGFLWGELLED